MAADPVEAQKIQDAIVEHVSRSLDKGVKIKPDVLREVVLLTLATLYLFGITEQPTES
jgi:hypothetical protein